MTIEQSNTLPDEEIQVELNKYIPPEYIKDNIMDEKETLSKPRIINYENITINSILLPEFFNEIPDKWNTKNVDTEIHYDEYALEITYWSDKSIDPKMF